jgi:hypothetical protein
MEKEITSVISSEERKEISEKAVLEIKELPTVKIVDLDKAVAIMKRFRDSKNLGNIVVIKANYINEVRELNKKFTYDKDVKNGVLYGVFKGLDERKNPVWAKIDVPDAGLNLNLEIPWDAQQWCVLRMWGHLEGSPYSIKISQKSRPLFSVVDAKMEAINEKNEIMKMNSGFKKIIALNAEQLVRLLRYLGVEVTDVDDIEVLQSKALRFVRDYPLEFEKKFDDPSRGTMEIVESAVSLGVIDYDLEVGYKYNGIFLGGSKHDVIYKLKSDTVTLTSIASKVEKDDNITNTLKSKNAGKAKEAKVADTKFD